MGESRLVGESERDPRAEYDICASRGHEPSGLTLTSNPPWQVCKHCGTHYRYETRLVEQNTPRPR